MARLKDIKSTGFKAPTSDYFDGLEDAVFAKLKTQELKESIGGEHGFKMPEGYLGNVEGKLFDSIKNETDEPKVISLFNKKRLMYLSGVAAAVLILFTVYLNQSPEANQELDIEMVENYIIDQNISTYELASLLTEEELQSINTDILEETFEDEDLEDYLIDNVDLENIIDQ